MKPWQAAMGPEDERRHEGTIVEMRQVIAEIRWLWELAAEAPPADQERLADRARWRAKAIRNDVTDMLTRLRGMRQVETAAPAEPVTRYTEEPTR